MGDKIKIAVLEDDGGVEFDVPVERDLTSDIVQFNPAGTIFDPANDDVDLILKQTSTLLQSIQTLLNSHATRHLPNGDDALATAIAQTLSALTNNTVGTNNSFARSDHTHNILTGNVSQQTPDQNNSEGSSPNLARADHTHNIPTASAVTISANTNNTQGNSSSFSRSNHTHDVTTANVVTQNADQSNSEGNSVGVARANHVHNIPTAQPVTSLTSSTNTQGNASTFAKSDHVHKIEIPVLISRTNNEVIANNGTDLLLDSMTLTPPAGTYLVFASVILSNNNRNADIIPSIYVGGVQVANTEEAMENNGQNNQTDSFMTYMTELEVTVNGSQAIEIRTRTTAGNTTFRLRTLRAMRIS